MFDLSPTKLIIVFVVVIVLFGPNRLPQVARQLGAAWRKATSFQQQVERELRQSIPELPKTRDLARFARSPLSMLNELADMSDASANNRDGPEPLRLDSSPEVDEGSPSPPRPSPRTIATLAADDPTLN